MATANSTITFCGVTFSRSESFGPTTLRRMFGKELPRHFRVARDGSVPVSTVINHLNKQGQIGLRKMHEQSEILTPRKPR